MPQIVVTDLRNGTFFQEGKDLFQVINYEHHKQGRGSGNIRVKVRNLRSGSITEKTYMNGSRVESADVEKKKAQFLYIEGDNYNFMDQQSFEQFAMSKAILGDSAKFLQEGMEVILLTFEDEALGIELPLSLVYSIAETGPGEKGNTVSNVYKEATLDNGLVARVPMFMSAGEKVRIDTRTGNYVERVK